MIIKYTLGNDYEFVILLPYFADLIRIIGQTKSEKGFKRIKFNDHTYGHVQSYQNWDRLMVN